MFVFCIKKPVKYFLNYFLVGASSYLVVLVGIREVSDSAVRQAVFVVKPIVGA